MSILIIIRHLEELITDPAVLIVKDGKPTGTITTMGYDQSENRAMEIAIRYRNLYPDAEIINLFHFRPTLMQYAEYIHALTEYYGSWSECGRYNMAAPELMHRCAIIKSTFRIA